MNDFVRINAPRVEKIHTILDTIDKSAKSNKVSGGYEHAFLLGGLYRRIDEVGCSALQEFAKEAPPQPKGVTKGFNAQSLLEGLTASQKLTLAYVAIGHVEQDVYDRGIE